MNGLREFDSHHSTMNKLIKQIKEKFPFNKETDCKEKYKETIQDYLYETITNNLL